MRKRRELFAIACAERPIWVRFDKYGSVPKIHRAEKTVDEWERIAREDDDVGGRRDAVEALARSAATETDADTAARSASLVGWLLQEDASRFVRREAALALGALRGESGRQLGPAAVAALKQAASWDDDPIVRVAAFNALARFGRNAELEAFGKSEFERAPTWATMAAAAGLVCAADPWGAEEWLVERLDRSSPHDVLESRMVAHLVRLKSQGAIAELLRRARDSAAHEQSQAAAVQRVGVWSKCVATKRSGRSWSSSGRPRASCARPRSTPSGDLGRPEALTPLTELYRRTIFARERRAIEAVFALDWVRALGGDVPGDDAHS